MWRGSLNRHHVEPAALVAAQRVLEQIGLRAMANSCLFRCADAGSSPAKCGMGAVTHFHKHDGVVIAADNVQFAALTTHVARQYV